MDRCHNLQQVLHEEIPLTQHMGIYVKRCDVNGVELAAPLAPNINHKCTAFGGSLYSVAVLTGWGLVYETLAQHKLAGHIVIQQSQVQYLHPVDGEIETRCCITEQKQRQRFIKTYQRKSMSRIELEVEVIFQGRVAMLFKGRYVVHS